MPTHKTPGVYVEEISKIPPSVAEVCTAIPAFIGYTERAGKSVDGDLHNTPEMISSFDEFQRYYGIAYPTELAVSTSDRVGGGFDHEVGFQSPGYVLWHCMKLFFANGGGRCYVVSVGNYRNPPEFVTSRIRQGLDAVRAEDEPTLLVIPEAVYLPEAGFQEIAEATLQQCADLQDRFAILDVQDGEKDPAVVDWTRQRAMFGTQNLKYGAAYYPFLVTSLGFDELDDNAVTVSYMRAGRKSSTLPLSKWRKKNGALYIDVKRKLAGMSTALPPSAAIAGIYAITDATRGVWKAPANMGVNGIIKPAVSISHEQQEAMNVDASGKSINAIREFPGQGALVWGARTLAGNDPEWRYVSVRRFVTMVEESIRKSTEWAVFEPNEGNTWARICTIIENYLQLKWREGALAGATSEDAFFVQCGLGSTMTAQDIVERRLLITIGLAVTRPAEFIVLNIAHKVQEF